MLPAPAMVTDFVELAPTFCGEEAVASVVELSAAEAYADDGGSVWGEDSAEYDEGSHPPLMMDPVDITALPGVDFGAHSVPEPMSLQVPCRARGLMWGVVGSCGEL